MGTCTGDPPLILAALVVVLMDLSAETLGRCSLGGLWFWYVPTLSPRERVSPSTRPRRISVAT
eukprot:3817127-Pleurochrysis_carterae.AAC.3